MNNLIFITDTTLHKPVMDSYRQVLKYKTVCSNTEQIPQGKIFIKTQMYQKQLTLLNKHCMLDNVVIIFHLVYNINPQYIMDSKLRLFLGIMLFYILLSYVLFPLGFYYLVNKSLSSAGNGFVVGSIVSLVLWLTVGSKMVK